MIVKYYKNLVFKIKPEPKLDGIKRCTGCYFFTDSKLNHCKRPKDFFDDIKGHECSEKKLFIYCIIIEKKN